jgi:hypothetical protein
MYAASAQRIYKIPTIHIPWATSNTKAASVKTSKYTSTKAEHDLPSSYHHPILRLESMYPNPENMIILNLGIKRTGWQTKKNPTINTIQDIGDRGIK